jgi:hypothetical protein
MPPVRSRCRLAQEVVLPISERKSASADQDCKNLDPSERRGDQPRAQSIDQFCRCYGVGRTMVYAQIKMGQLRARKIGKRTIITHDDAEDWLRNLPRVGVRQ